MALELSILIRTTASRLECTTMLSRDIYNQIKSCQLINGNYHDVFPSNSAAQYFIGEQGVEVLFNNHETDNVGKKANDLLKEAKGNYVVFIDSDDQISPNYISLILEACKYNADCIGISGTILHEGITKQWHISKDYGHWFAKDNVFYRTPNHISPVKRDIALKAMFPEIPHGEDAEYSRRILPYLQTETKITENIYFYYPSH